MPNWKYKKFIQVQNQCFNSLKHSQTISCCLGLSQNQFKN